MYDMYFVVLTYEHFVHISSTVINLNVHADTVQFCEVYKIFH